MTALVLIFGEVLPKTYAITNPETVAARGAGDPGADPALCAGVTVVRTLVRGILRMFGVRTDPDSHILALREEIAGAIALGHSEGAVEKEDRDRLLATLDLSDRTVEEVMRHRSQIEMIDADKTPTRSCPGAGLAPHPPAAVRGDRRTSWASSMPRTCCARWTVWCARRRPATLPLAIWTS
jgi:Mg2+/Co2+ transporter CorB